MFVFEQEFSMNEILGSHRILCCVLRCNFKLYIRVSHFNFLSRAST